MWKRASPTLCATYPSGDTLARPVRSKRMASFGNVLGVHSKWRGMPTVRSTDLFQNSRSHQ